jgi:acyl-CoA thioester hydrolase
MPAGATRIADLRPGVPLPISTATVHSEQTNTLGHLKASEYVRLFDDAVNVLFPLTGLADARLLHGTTSPFLMDLHVCYLAELRAGDSVAVAFLHLEHDAKRARCMMTMHTAPGDRLAATVELLLVNMDTVRRAPAPWSAGQLAIWDQLRAAHATVPALVQAGRAIGPLSKPGSKAWTSSAG